MFERKKKTHWTLNFLSFNHNLLLAYFGKIIANKIIRRHLIGAAKFLSKTLPTTLPADSKFCKEPIQGSWLKGEKTLLRLPRNCSAQLCGYSSSNSQGGHLPCQNETEPKLADYSEAQICSQIPETELGHGVQQPGSGPGPDTYSPVLWCWGSGLTSLGIRFFIC